MDAHHAPVNSRASSGSGVEESSSSSTDDRFPSGEVSDGVDPAAAAAKAFISVVVPEGGEVVEGAGGGGDARGDDGFEGL